MDKSNKCAVMFIVGVIHNRDRERAREREGMKKKNKER
jgi:hypothetical protein